MTKTFLELQNVNKKLSDSFSITNINGSFSEGQVHGIVGENASGKSSLLKIIAGIYLPDQGNIILHQGDSIKKLKSDDVIYLQQELSLFPNLSIYENLFIDNYKLGIKSIFLNRYSLMRKTQDLLDYFNIPLSANEKVQYLNSYEAQIVTLLKACTCNSKIIILDEPTQNMDNKILEIINYIIKESKKRNQILLIVSHKLNYIKDISDTITVLQKGSIISHDKSKDYTVDDLIDLISSKKSTQNYPKLFFNSSKEVLAVDKIYINKNLSDFYFNIYENEILAIMVDNNTIKEDIIDSILGEKYCDIYIDSKKSHIQSTVDALRNGITYLPSNIASEYIFENFSLVDNLTISSLERFNNKIMLDNYIKRDVAQNYVELLKISPNNINHKVNNFSTGNKQKIALARNIMRFSNIYILDDPTNFLDVISRNDFYNILNDLLLNNASILLFSSNINEVLGISDRIILVKTSGEIKELNTKETNKKEIIGFLTK